MKRSTNPGRHWQSKSARIATVAGELSCYGYQTASSNEPNRRRFRKERLSNLSRITKLSDRAVLPVTGRSDGVVQSKAQHDRFSVGAQDIHESNDHQDVSAEVLEYAVECRIFDFLRQGIHLARETFESVRNLDTRIQHDPDVDEKRIIIDATVEGEVADILAAQRRYTEEWMRIAPLEVREKIRFLYHAVRLLCRQQRLRHPSGV